MFNIPILSPFKFKSASLYLLILWLLPAFVKAQTAVSALQQQLTSIHSLSAKFQQTIYDQGGTILNKSQGLLDIKRPNRFRWQVTQPLPQTIITNGDKVWIYDLGLKQLTIRKLSDRMSQTPILLLSSNKIHLADDFVVQQQSDGSYLLTPKRADQSFQSVRLWFKNGVIARMQLQTNVGQQSRIDFSQVKMNPPLTDQLFTFTAPKGVDVVNQY